LIFKWVNHSLIGTGKWGPLAKSGAQFVGVRVVQFVEDAEGFVPARVGGGVVAGAALDVVEPDERIGLVVPAAKVAIELDGAAVAPGGPREVAVHVVDFAEGLPGSRLRCCCSTRGGA
jgi:hypothetical protein